MAQLNLSGSFALVEDVTQVLQPVKLRDLMEYVSCTENSKVKNSQICISEVATKAKKNIRRCMLQEISYKACVSLVLFCSVLRKSEWI